MRMGIAAVELLAEGISNVVMCEIDGKICPVDISFALIADRMYKNKLQPGDLDPFMPEQLEAMRVLCKKRQNEIRHLYKVARILNEHQQARLHFFISAAPSFLH